MQTYFLNIHTQTLVWFSIAVFTIMFTAMPLQQAQAVENSDTPTIEMLQKALKEALAQIAELRLKLGVIETPNPQTDFQVNSLGNRKVEAFFERGSACSGYTISWGDGKKTVVKAKGTCAQVTVNEHVTHKYKKEGTYKVVLTQGDNTKWQNVTVTKEKEKTAFDFKAEAFRDFNRVNVSFTRGSSCSAYTVSWGDGQQDVVNGGGTCPQVTVKVEIAHHYAKAGVYTVSLTQGDKTVSKRVKVIAKYIDTITPIDDPEPEDNEDFDFKAEAFRDFDRVNVSFTRGSSCSAYTINWGNGKQDVVKARGTCPQVTVKTEVSYLYGKAGTYTVTLTQGDKSVSRQVTVIAKYIDSITPIDDPKPEPEYDFDFKAEAFRDFDRVNVSFTRGSSCSAYTVSWGDGQQDVVNGGGACPQVTVRAEFSHHYAKAGIYTVTLTQGGKSVSKQVTVIAKYKDTPVGFGSVLGASTQNIHDQLKAIEVEHKRLSALVAELE